nr:transposase [Campylobacter troglodytis]
MSGEIEVDESYFGGVRVKRGRGAGKKTSVFLLRATHSSLYEKEC